MAFLSTRPYMCVNPSIHVRQSVHIWHLFQSVHICASIRPHMCVNPSTYVRQSVHICASIRPYIPLESLAGRGFART